MYLPGNSCLMATSSLSSQSSITTRGCQDGFSTLMISRASRMESVSSCWINTEATGTYDTFVFTHNKYKGMVYLVVLYVPSRKTMAPYLFSRAFCHSVWWTNRNRPWPGGRNWTSPSSFATTSSKVLRSFFAFRALILALYISSLISRRLGKKRRLKRSGCCRPLNITCTFRRICARTSATSDIPSATRLLTRPTMSLSMGATRSAT